MGYTFFTFVLTLIFELNWPGIFIPGFFVVGKRSYDRDLIRTSNTQI